MQKAEKAPERKIYRKSIATNNRARHDYLIEDTVEAGIQLFGSEVKSLRTKGVNFADCYARVYENECWLIGLQISPYEKSHVQVPETDRRRKLLLSRREIDKLRAKTEQAGRTIVPLELYFKDSWVKVLLGLGKGKTFSDKRDSLRKAEAKREIDRTMKSVRKGIGR